MLGMCELGNPHQRPPIMDLMGDVRSERWLYVKGYLFGLLGLLAAAGLLVEDFTWRNAALFVIAIWAFCRFYYFLFYVIEKYADPSFKFAGIGSFLRYRMVKAARDRLR